MVRRQSAFHHSIPRIRCRIPRKVGDGSVFSLGSQVAYRRVGSAYFAVYKKKLVNYSNHRNNLVHYSVKCQRVRLKASKAVRL